MAKPRAGRDARATTIRLNKAALGKTEGGRRSGLASSAAEIVVRTWIDDAVEQLSIMPYTCSLDVAEAFPDGLSPRRIGWLLGVTEQAVDGETRKQSMRRVMRALREYLER